MRTSPLLAAVGSLAVVLASLHHPANIETLQLTIIGCTALLIANIISGRKR